MIRGALIGSRFEKCTLDGYVVNRHNADAEDACRRVASGEIDGVFLFGPPGVGKTHLLVGIAKAFIEKRMPAEAESEVVKLPSLRELLESQDYADDAEAPVSLSPLEQAHEPLVEFWPMLDLVSELRAEIKAGELELSRRCRTCDLLVIDDLGAERATDFVQEELLRILDWRYRDRQPMAVATNLTDREITERYGWATLSRWAEFGELVKIEDSDYRLGKPKARART